ncbi:ADP-ribosylglycohydrolase family protein [Dyella sp. ASV21]|uniref:ADP-ribosylglycohydrolase family protein n=1 Tax=Dyella sp. ASV21 TaxID=2795114 RepID=UPI0018EC9C2D|nr:ADP-ribosylglycohydrolase family protein [Dyella sp. ASV21]
MSRLRSIYVRRDRIAGSLWGLMIGSAFGRSADDLPPSLEPGLTNQGLAPSSPLPQTWSMEGAQALCLLMALQFPDEFPREGLVRRAIEWSIMGLCYPDAALLIDDTGTRAMVHAMEGHSPGLPSRTYQESVTRGALLRMVPALLCHQGNWEEDFVALLQILLPQPAEDTTLTPASMMYALWLAAELDGADQSWDDAAERLRSLGPPAGLSKQTIVAVLEPSGTWGESTDAPSPIDMLHAAREALNSAHSYTEAVGHAISARSSRALLGAVIGGIAGVRFGMYGIPTVWRDTLRGRHQIEHALSTLFDAQASAGGQQSNVERTSRTHPLQIGTLELSSGGRIGITFCPGKKQLVAVTGAWDRDLGTDLRAIKAWGAAHLVTLLAPWEFVELDVIELGQLALDEGLTWHHAPILDGHAPDICPPGYRPEEWFEGRWPVIFPELVAALKRGEGVVVHCKGGLGRAGTVAALLLAASEPGLPADDVIQRVRSARPNAIETATQEHYLMRTIATAPRRSH